MTDPLLQEPQPAQVSILSMNSTGETLPQNVTDSTNLTTTDGQQASVVVYEPPVFIAEASDTVQVGRKKLVPTVPLARLTKVSDVGEVMIDFSLPILVPEFLQDFSVDDDFQDPTP